MSPSPSIPRRASASRRPESPPPTPRRHLSHWQDRRTKVCDRRPHPRLSHPARQPSWHRRPIVLRPALRANRVRRHIPGESPERSTAWIGCRKFPHHREQTRIGHDQAHLLRRHMQLFSRRLRQFGAGALPAFHFAGHDGDDSVLADMEARRDGSGSPATSAPATAATRRHRAGAPVRAVFRQLQRSAGPPPRILRTSRRVGSESKFDCELDALRCASRLSKGRCGISFLNPAFRKRSGRQFV